MRTTPLQTNENLIGHLTRLTTQQAQLQHQLSTGSRVERPSDAPAETARLMNIAEEQSRMGTHRQNLNRAEALLQSSFANLEKLHDLQSRSLEVAALAQGVTDESTRTTYANELDSLIERAAALLNEDLQGTHLFGADQTSADPFSITRDADTGRIVDFQYEGGSGTFAFNIGERTSLQAVPSAEDNVNSGSVVRQLIELRDAVEANDGEAIQSVADQLGTSEDDLLLAVSGVGNRLETLEFTRTVEDRRFQNLGMEASRITDVDFAKTVAELNQAQMTYQAALQSGVRILNTSLLQYI